MRDSMSDANEAAFNELMRLLIVEMNQFRSMLRAGRNVRVTLHVTGLKLAKTEVAFFMEAPG